MTTDAPKPTPKVTHERDLPKEPPCPACSVPPHPLTGMCGCNNK